MVVRYGDEDVKASRKTWSVVCKLKRGRWAPSWLVGKNRRVRTRRVRGGCAQGLPVRGGVKQTWSSRTRPYCFLTVAPPYRLPPPFHDPTRPLPFATPLILRDFCYLHYIGVGGLCLLSYWSHFLLRYNQSSRTHLWSFSSLRLYTHMYMRARTRANVCTDAVTRVTRLSDIHTPRHIRTPFRICT